MLSSIHPLGERSRHNRYWLTAGAHVAGGALGGAVLGALVGVLGWLSLLVLDQQHVSRVVAFGVMALLVALVEALSLERRLPSRAHQVDENWMQKFRGWVYGSGYGFELGFAVSTIITTALVHLMLFAMVVSGSWVGAVMIGVVFGAARTGLVFTTSRITTGQQLRTLLRRVDGWSKQARTLGAMLSVTVGVVSFLVVFS